MMASNMIEFTATGGELQSDVPVQLWSPLGVRPDQSLPLLIAHDGPEYDTRAELTKHISGLIESRAITSHRIALVEPVAPWRNNWYGASSTYNAILANSVIPAIREQAASVGPVVGMGASLGALAMLSCEYQQPGTFGGLFLQSASFHHPNFDGGTKDYLEYDKVASFVGKMLKAPKAEQLLQISITCGDESNLLGNQAMAEALSEQGHVVDGEKVSGGHDFESWGKAFSPYLLNLLHRCWNEVD